jgi:hypothetical protein
MLRMPAEEEHGGRYITMEGGGELRMDWIDEEQGEWVDCGRRRRGSRGIGRQEKGRGGRWI